MADKGKPMISEKDFKLNESLSRIKHVIIVMSGKGGVGKSTLSVNLAMGLAMSGAQTGIMDIDIHGPNIPKMLHIEDEHIIGVEDGLMPVEVPPRLKVMSMAFLLPDKDSPVVWRG
ncbi:MAG: P-loop NTPase, partial [Candidatus Methanomethylophilaceae archaeon]